MLLKKQFPNMERTLVLLAVLDFSRLVFANQGEPGSSAWQGPQSLQLFQSSETPGLPPASIKIVNPVGSTEMKLATSPALSGTANLMQTPISLKSESASMHGRTENSVKRTEMRLTAVPAFTGTASESSTPDTQTLSTDVVKESVTTESLPSVTVIESVPHSSLTSIPSATLANVTAPAHVSEYDSFLSSSQVPSTSALLSSMQSHLHVSQSPIQLSNSVFASAVEGPISTSSPPVTVFVSVSRSSSKSRAPTLVTNITASTSMSEYDAFLSNSPVQQSSIVPNVTRSTSYGTSLLMSSSVAVPEFNAFSSQDGIQPTTVYLPTVQSSLLLSSSAFMLPPTTASPGNPGSPVIQDVIVQSASSVFLQWNATNTQFISNFSVEFSTDSVSWNRAVCQHSLVKGACIVTQTDATVTMLKAYRNYTFRVAAQGPFGKSNYSTESKWVLTSEAAPSGSPRITTAYNLSSHEIYVAWHPPSPETLNGKLRRYQIRIREVGTQSTTSPSPVTGGITHTVVGFSVASSSSLSPGAFTPVPTTPSEAGSPETEHQELNTEEERKVPQVESAVVIDAGLNVSYHIGQLKKWTAYEVEVRAITVAPGPFSNKFIVWTDEDVPSRPTRVKAIAVNSTAISVHWAEPAEVNGVIVKYEVRYAKRNTSKPADTRSVQETMSVMLSSLNPFTVYEISISAFTSKGEGNRTTVQEQTDEGQPSAPQNISTESLNSTAILVSWKEPMHPNGKIKYRLFFRKESDPVAFFRPIYDGERSQYLVFNLKPFTQYSFKVNAYNVKYNLSSLSIVAMDTTAQAAPSGPPQNLRAIANSSSSIVLYWMPPKAGEQNGQITSYNIHISGAPELNTSGTVFAVTGLQAYTNYSFMVQAVNAGGTGPYSSVITNRTFEAEPSSPRNFTAKSVNSTAIKVTWVQALHPNGIIRYKLYMRLSKNDETVNQLVYEGLDTFYVVAGLEEYVMYTFTVVSFNIKYGWTSKQVVAKETTHPAEPTGPPQNVAASSLSSSSIQVTWDPPLLSERNGLITHYTVQYTTPSGQSGTLNTTDNRTSIVVKDLSVFTAYSFSVKAWNVVGTGLYSESVRNTTLEDRPSPPTSVAAKTVNSTAINVTWRAPLQPNGNISYRLYFWQSSQGFETSKLAYDGLLLECTVADLHEYVTYTFMIQAYNVKYSWKSIGTNVSETTHPAAPAGPPQNVTALTQSSTSIRIMWSPPLVLDRNGIITRYNVKYNVSSGKEANISTPDNSTQIVVKNLKKYSSYYFTVQAENKIGVGPSSVAVVNTTFEDVPDVPIIESVNNAKIDSLEVMWKRPVETNGVIKAYTLCWSLANLQNLTCAKLSGATRSHVIPKLKPYTQYRISLNASTSVGFGPAATEVSRTAEGVPSKPRDLRAWNTSEYSIFVTWKTPLNVNGELQRYKVFYEVVSSTNRASEEDVGLNNKTTLSSLTAYTTYKITVQAFTGAGGGATDSVYVITEEAAPSSAVSLQIFRKTESSIELLWDPPTTLNGKIGYYLHYTTTTAVPAAGDSFVLPGDVRHKVLSNLKPYTKYQFSIVAYNLKRNLSARASSIYATTMAAAPNDPPRNVVIDRTTSNSITLSWDPPLEPNGEIEGYVVSYNEKENPNKLNIYNNVKGRVHTLSDLKPWRYYLIRVACRSSGGLGPYSEWVESQTDPGAAATKPESSTHIGLIVGLILVIVIIAVLLLVGFFIIRRKRSNFDQVLDDRDDYTNGQPVRMKKLSRKRKSLQKRLMGSTESLTGLDDLAARRERRQPVPIDDFERHVDRMHMDGDHGFSEEYSLVQPDDEFSFQQFLNPANKYKNRYANIVAYDHTRVLLNPIEGVPGSDYINANFIDGYNRQRAYVAAQGPLMETFDDFWRMMWEQMSTVIVMLTKLEERGRRKCDQYWPERGTKGYGPIQVTLKETLNMSHYTVRKFIVTHKKYPDDDRVIRQFHFTAWPDHGVPSHPTPLLSLVRHTSSANRESVGPMVVHCSAGVGRTGTFITLDVMLQRISQEDSVDVFGFVRQMRYQRNFMVQTEAQYVFIHDALLEAITCGVTEVEAKDLSSRIRELRQFDPETGYTYLENEFCRLTKEENLPVAFKSASLNCNAAKNRYANILPFESTRVHLKMRPGEMGSDYINANFVDGYCQPRAYIATQAPIPDTFEDFWRLVWEQESATIVMLTREEEAGKVKCHRYWSSEGSQLYGVILVELIEEASFGDYISRKFKLTHTEEKVSRTVSQFQYTDWPDAGTPDSGVGIVDLIGQVQKWQQQSGNTVIVIHCSGGVGRTGVFCGISMMIERVKSEGVIDVFQTVQAMRLQRPAMVQTAEQYEFCYTTLQEYLDSFDLYANFQ